MLTNCGRSLVSKIDTHSHRIAQGTKVLRARQGSILLLEHLDFCEHG